MLETVVLAVFVFLLLQTTVQNYHVEGTSMKPTLDDGEFLLANKAVYTHIDLTRAARILRLSNPTLQEFAYPFHPPRHGEIVIFRFPRDQSRSFVKRVIGVPGDTVEIRSGRVYVNGRRLEEPYVKAPSFSSVPPLTLGPDEYYVLGDNRIASSDSRDWGTVPLENIVGRAWVSYWPPDSMGLILASGQ